MEVLKDSIQRIISDMISSIRNDCISWIETEKEMEIHKLGYDILKETDRPKYYIRNKIKIEEKGKFPYWNPKYLNESLNHIYIKLIANHIIDELKRFADDLHLTASLNNDTTQFKKELENRKVLVNKLFKDNRDKGVAIVRYLSKDKNDEQEHENENKIHRLLYPRFEIIKKMNLEYGDENQGSSTATYPYFKVNGSQFYEFEYVYRFMQILKSITDIMEEKNHFRPNPIFADIRSEQILLKVLQKFDAIDKEHKAVERKFMPICDAFWDNYRYDLSIFIKGSKEADFHRYLNSEYDAEIKGKLSDGKRHTEKIDVFVKDMKLYKKLQDLF